ncbi:TonB-dependent receptor plug domain-containing protein [Myxococcus virescens]|uniref:TonB-dependent receptor plug domain-containing protein n=1 Tax=Myxococcus virescens TaxID=83456 RepID=UPI003DA48C0A
MPGTRIGQGRWSRLAAAFTLFVHLPGSALAQSALEGHGEPVLPQPPELTSPPESEPSAQEGPGGIAPSEPVFPEQAPLEQENKQRATVVTATRGLPLGSSPLATSVLLGRDIANSPTRSADDVLRVLPGVTVPRSDSRALHPTAQGIALRGIGRGRTLVLLDGLPLNDPFGGWIQWNKVAKSQMDRVEVVRGASSSLYGSLAMGGVIQVFTRPVEQRRLVLEGDYGERVSPHLGVFAATPIGSEFAVSASADVYRTDGYTQVAPKFRGPVDIASSYVSQNAALRGAWKHGAWTTFAQVNYFRQEATAGTPLTNNEQWIADGSVGTTMGLERGKLELFAFGGKQRFENANSRVDSTRDSEVPALQQTIPVSNAGGSALWSQKLGERQDLLVGVDLRWVQATNQEDVFDATGDRIGSRSAEGQQAVGGFFAEWNGRPWDWLTLGAGLRVDGWLNNGGNQVSTMGETSALADRRDGALSPRVTSVVRISEALALRGAGYTGFRAPNLNELYRGFFSGQVLVTPNPDLGPERLYGGELGLDWVPVPRARLSFTVYAGRTAGRIEQVTVDATTRQRRNIASANNVGGELEASWRPLTSLRLYGSYSLTRSRISSFPEATALEGKELANQPRQSGSVTAQWSSPEWVDVSLRLHAESSQFDDDQNTLKLPSFALVDLTVSRSLREAVELFASVSNLLDSEVTTRRTQTLEQVGTPRTVWGGFRVRL